MLEQLFKKLGYNSHNGLYILENSEKDILDKFPSRISRVLTEIIKPYAVFSLDFQFSREGHVQPFNNPLILFYNNPSKEEYSLIPKHSFNLSRSPVVIINRGGTIEIFNGFDFSDGHYNELNPIDIDPGLLSVKSLRTGKGWREIYRRFFTKSRTVDRFLLSNITDARRILIAQEPDFPQGNLLPEVANRLIGRLIFIRYLIDRNVVFNDQKILKGSSKEERQHALNKMLLDHNRTYNFFEYINQKFEGDLFPLTFENNGFPFQERHYVREENLKVLHHLFTCSNFFSGKKVRGYSVQPSMFNVYDFEIIPVELISNIYESFLGNTIFSKTGIVTQLSKQKEVKAYYTPPFLVDYVLSQTVNPHLRKENTESCKILDPSCGSGIFLVEALRQIIDKEIRNESFTSTDELIPNHRLWQLLSENIFGIDIDSNAIEITTFSLYITLLDYKTHPREIENFSFKPLRNKNLFGGKQSDFFQTKSLFNKVFNEEVQLDFIIGNPPWGKVKSSCYIDYIKNRSKTELSDNKKLGLNLTIGNKEISQAFILRAADFVNDKGKTKICFIVTGKNLYNSDPKSSQWRQYFLAKHNLHQCFDLFGVNNKVAGGRQLFDNANQPPVILIYSVKKSIEQPDGIVKHIVARANQYYHYFKTIVIEKNDVKHISQDLLKADDTLWKTLLYGNSLDYIFVKKLKSNFPSIATILENHQLQLKGGFKSRDVSIPSIKRKDTSHLWDFDYVEVEKSKDLQQYSVTSSKSFRKKLNELFENKKINEDLKVPQLNADAFFSGKKLLIKKGLDKYLDHRAVSAFTDSPCVFPATVAAIMSSKNHLDNEAEDVLYSLATIFNSKLFSYYLLLTSSSFGADRNRVNFREFLEMPFVTDSELVSLSRQIHSSLSEREKEVDKNDQSIWRLNSLIERKLYELYKVNQIEQELIHYALDVSIPIMKRADRAPLELPNIFRQVNDKNTSKLLPYCNIFFNHFSKRFNKPERSFIIDVYIADDFVAMHFKISNNRSESIKFYYQSSLSDAVSNIGSLALNEVSSALFVQQDIRGFNRDSFYVIKPNFLKNWHPALAHVDLIEFIESIATSELNHTKGEINERG